MVEVVNYARGTREAVLKLTQATWASCTSVLGMAMCMVSEHSIAAPCPEPFPGVSGQVLYQ